MEINTGGSWKSVADNLKYALGVCFKERNAALRWSAAWKQAAKFNYHADIGGYLKLNRLLEEEHKVAKAVYEDNKDEMLARWIAEDERDQARQVSRSRLRERDEATLLLTDCQDRVDRYFAKITSLKSQVQLSEKMNQNLITHHRIERDRAAFENEALQSQVNHLESDRDALAKKCDELRSVCEEALARLHNYATIPYSLIERWKKALGKA